MKLLDTLAFCCTNIITFRQLLIRYDAFRRTFDGMPLTEWFIQRSVLGPSHPVHALFTLDGVKDLEIMIIGQMHGKGLNSAGFTSQIEQFLRLLGKTDRFMEKAVAGHLVWKDRLVMSLRQYLLFGFQSRGIMNEPKMLMSMRGRHFKKEIAMIVKWRASHEFMLDSNEDDHASISEKIKLLKPENIFPLFLNLLSCFFFMMNNYVIEPSSAYYAEALGSSDALSGEKELKWTFHKVKLFRRVIFTERPSFSMIRNHGWSGSLVCYGFSDSILVLDKSQLQATDSLRWWSPICRKPHVFERIQLQKY